MSQSNNLALWESVEKTDPSYTKNFNRPGGFKGTAMNATWLAQRATELFGPCGIGWGMTVLNEEYVKGAPILVDGQVVGFELIHVVHAKLWYVHEGKRGEIEQFGQTQMSGRRNDGKFYTDEEAPKKSLTDATTKCLSMLGFGADIFKGYYDDNKYVAQMREEFAEPRDPAGQDSWEPKPEPPPPVQRARPQRDAGAKLTPAQHMKAIKNAANPAALKQAFALAWKQYENPSDPKAHTEAQLKFKDAYDTKLASFDAPVPGPEPEPPPSDDPFAGVMDE